MIGQPIPGRGGCPSLLGWDTAGHFIFWISLSSLESDAQILAHAVRSQCSIENSLHWVLDVTFNEDASRIRKDNSPLNFTILRRLALNLLSRDKTVRGSIAMKRPKRSIRQQLPGECDRCCLGDLS